MSRLAQHLITAASILLLSTAISFTGLSQTMAYGLAAKVQHVLVTNKTLAVSGNVNATVSGTVNAPVTAPSEPVQFGGKIAFSGSSSSAADNTKVVYTVPAGNRLVIEYVAAVFAAQLTDAILGISTGTGPLFTLSLRSEPNCLTNCNWWIASEQVRLYANAGESVTAHDVGLPINGTFSFSGYLVNS